MPVNEYIVEIVIENKAQARDPVGETIQRDLLAKKGYAMISNVRSGQYLRISLTADNEKNAREIVTKMSSELRLHNPVTQTLNILNVNKKS